MSLREHDAAVAQASEELVHSELWMNYVRAVSERSQFLASNPSDDLSMEATHLAKYIDPNNK